LLVTCNNGFELAHVCASTAAGLTAIATSTLDQLAILRLHSAALLDIVLRTRLDFAGKS
jgi:hypothetical protein